MKKLLLVFCLLLCTIGVLFAQTPQYFVGNGSGSNSIPFGASSWSDQRCQFLYIPGEFGTPPVGFITKIYWRASTSTSVTTSTYSNFRIDIGQSNIVSLPGTTWVPGLTTVYTSASQVIPAVPGQWFSITLQTPYFFDPTQSLIVDSRQTATAGAIPLANQTAVGTRRAYGPSAAPVPSGSGVQRYDFGFDIIQGFPCTGAPTTTLDGPNEVCPNKPFTLTFGTFYTGVTRVWEKSTDGINWVPSTGTVNPNTGWLTEAIWQETWFRCKLTCIATNQTFITTPKKVSIAPFYYCYCDNSRAGNTAGIDVGNVTVVSGGGDTVLNNGTGAPVESNVNADKAYSEFRYSVPPVPMYPDSTYNFWAQQINSGAFTNGIGTIFIDYNRNGRFDYYERVFTQTTMNVLPNPGLVGTTGWQVPKDSFKYHGLTGMRVIMRDGATAPDSCLAYGNGETEDYLVDLRYMPCAGAPNAGKIEGDTSMCAGYDYILTDTSYQTKRHGIERFWQVSGDGVDWYDIQGSFNKDTAKRTFTGQPLYYRVGAVCTHTDDTSYTATHKVNLKPTYKCYCHSQSTGTFEDTSDIGAFEMVNFAVGNTGAHLLNPSAWYRRQDYTDMPPIVVDVDSVYNFHVFHTMPKNMHADAKVTVFVDFNNNKRYDIPEERIFTGFTSIGYHTLVKNLVIPNNVIVNVPTGMRVILNNDVAPNIQSDSACGEYTSGETEDFIVMFKRDFAQSVLDVNKGLEHVDVFPNPTTGKFTMQFRSTTAKEVKVTVTSVTGQVVLQQSYQHSGDVFRQDLDLSNQAKGVYMIVLDAGTEKVTRRLTVQ